MNESDHDSRLAKLEAAACAMMSGDDAATLQWLTTPNAMFDNKTPIEHAVTEAGMFEVEDLIGRIRHGVFS